MQKVLWKKHVWHRQTAKQLAKEYQKSESWIRQQLDKFSVKKPVVQAQPVVIVADNDFCQKNFRCSCRQISAPQEKSSLENVFD
ncbi:MAG: hypothetical protein COT31_03545 [Candidatus Moranbacteria bacterium CG08_land_8_20_14_0_20_34_16]|nr:MAG: hypothetical protein COT31_03545 [Candidatus Moranbacteria bacterium CG08_land_8_20_14_0_20_34_16]